MKPYSIDSSIGRILGNPLGADLLTSFLRQAGLLHLRGLVFNPLVRMLPFRALTRLAPSQLDTGLLAMMCRKMNAYEGEKIPSDPDEISRKWWKEAVCYQIYPRSFRDADGDGYGDIRGITEKLDYLKDLGIDVIWLSPVYDSPEDDNGYDIRDYYKILPRFGTMEDFDGLLKGVHARGMKLIMDLVINHTSDEHEWFRKALADPESPYRGYYIFRSSGDAVNSGTASNGGDTLNGGNTLNSGKTDPAADPPNNWRSMFSGSAWDRLPDGSWYLHIFSRKQPDLDWECAPMREELYAMIRWWLDKGIDGFRLDVINFISKEKGLPDGNVKLGELTGFTGVENYMFGPQVHAHLQELRRETFARYDVTTVGECPGLGSEMTKYFVHEARNELDMTFNFDHFDPPGADRMRGYQYDLNYLKTLFIAQAQAWGNGVWNATFLENHDTLRMIDKVGCAPEQRFVLAKMLGGLQLTFRGTPYIFQGQELGMRNPGFQSMDELRDIESLNYYREHLAQGEDAAALEKGIFFGSRDNGRAPVSWSDAPQAGFSAVEPWIRVCGDYRECNAAKQMDDPDSVLSFYRQLIALRKSRRELVYGDFTFHRKRKRDVFAYTRRLRDSATLVVMNLGSESRRIAVSAKETQLTLSNYPDAARRFRPYEIRIYTTC